MNFRNITYTVLFFLFVGFALLTYTSPGDDTVNLLEQFKPCEQPITYSINKVDNNFNLTESEFTELAKQAEDLWENNTQRDLFLHLNSGGVLNINLVYDPEISEDLRSLEHYNSQVDERQRTYDDIYQKYQNLSDVYNEKLEAYNSKLDLYNQKLDSYNLIADRYEQDLNEYNRDVESFNRYGGSNAERRSLQRRGSELDERRRDLEERGIELDQMYSDLSKQEEELDNVLQSVNFLVDQLNSLREDINLKITQSNEFITEDTRFGEYVTDYSNQGVGSRTREINIFGFNSQKDLILTIAHEFGHSLGIGHLDNEKALMFSRQSQLQDSLTGDDKAALKEICSGESTIE